MDQIGLKTHILGGEKKHYCEDANNKKEKFVILGVVTNDFIDPRFPDGNRIDLILFGSDKMRQENQGTKGCSYQAKAGK